MTTIRRKSLSDGVFDIDPSKMAKRPCGPKGAWRLASPPKCSFNRPVWRATLSHKGRRFAIAGGKTARGNPAWDGTAASAGRCRPMVLNPGPNDVAGVVSCGAAGLGLERAVRAGLACRAGAAVPGAAGAGGEPGACGGGQGRQAAQPGLSDRLQRRLPRQARRRPRPPNPPWHPHRRRPPPPSAPAASAAAAATDQPSIAVAPTPAPPPPRMRHSGLHGAPIIRSAPPTAPISPMTARAGFAARARRRRRRRRSRERTRRRRVSTHGRRRRPAMWRPARAAYRTFDPSDCTYQPLDGPRRICTK